MTTSKSNANVISLSFDKSNPVRSEALIKECLVQLPKPLQLARDVAHVDLKSAIQHLFDHVDDSLFEIADRASSNLEQNVFFESMREIRIQRRAMEKCFLLNIDQRFVALAEGGDIFAYNVSHADSQLPDDLSTISKEELEELVAIDSLVSKSLAQNKNALRVLALRINGLVTTVVSEKSSPLTPRALADSFVAAATLIKIDIKAKLVLFKLFERYVVNTLGDTVNRVNRVLTEQGVPIPKLSTYDEPHSQVSSSAQSYPRAPRAEKRAGSLYGTLQSLMHESDKLSQPLPEPSYSSHLPEEKPDSANETYGLLSALSALQRRQIQNLEGANTNGPRLLSSSDIQAAVLSATGKELLDEHSQDVIKLVDMLFSFILDDQNLPGPVKLILANLQIPFIKVALADEDFFNKEGHSARRLLNEMAMASIGWSGDTNNGDVLLNKIKSVVSKILNEFESNFEIFTLLLTDFIAFMEKERRRVSLFEKRAIDAEDGKAKSEVGRQHVDASLDELLKAHSVPAVFTQFVKGPWSNILFLIYMRQGMESQEWSQSLRVAKELVWCATPISSDEHKLKLTALMPRLKVLLKKGLDNISFNPVKQAKFIEQLDDHCQASLDKYEQEKRESSAALSDESETTEVLEDEPITITPQPSAEVTVAVDAKNTAEKEESEVESSVLAATEPSSAEQPSVASPSTDVQTPELADSQYRNLVDNFTVGVWFEKMEEGRASYRCRLAAIIRGTGKYIFVNRAGVKVAEETRDSLALQLQNGHLRTLDDGMLFDRALESVIANLRKPK